MTCSVLKLHFSVVNDHERNIVEIKDFSVCVLYKKKKNGARGRSGRDL